MEYEDETQTFIQNKTIHSFIKCLKMHMTDLDPFAGEATPFQMLSSTQLNSTRCQTIDQCVPKFIQ